MSDKNTVTAGNRQYYLSTFKTIEPSYRNDPGVLARIGKAAGHSVQTMRKVLQDLENELSEWDFDQVRQAREREEDYLQAAQSINLRCMESANHWAITEGKVLEAAIGTLNAGIESGTILPLNMEEARALQSACDRSNQVFRGKYCIFG